MLHHRLLLEWADIEGCPGVRSATMVHGSLTTWEVVLRSSLRSSLPSAVVRIDFPPAYPFDPPAVKVECVEASHHAEPLGMLHPAVWCPTVTAADVIAEIRRLSCACQHILIAQIDVILTGLVVAQ